MVTAKKNRMQQALDLAHKAGVHMMRQRLAVLEVVAESYDHPTAAQIYERVRNSHKELSLATVYNSLETLASAGVINHLNFNNGSARFCPNLVPHVHLLDDVSGEVIDIQLKKGLCPEDVFDLPKNCVIHHMAACLHGSVTPATPVSRK